MDSLLRLHLNGLRAVDAVARHGTVALAAADLGVTPGAVSQHVLRAEHQLGRRLFRRTARGLEAEPDAAAFLGELRAGFRILAAAAEKLNPAQANRLTVSVAPVFATKWLVPRLAGFQQAHPKLQVRIDASVALADLDAGDVDVAIRVGSGRWARTEAVAFARMILFPVCSPDLAARLRTPQDLGRVPAIRDANSLQPWRTWLAAAGLDETALAPGPTFSDAALCLDAAMTGQGVMMAWPTLALDALSFGRVVMPFALQAPGDQSYWFVTSKRRKPSPAARAFCRWVAEELRASLARVPALSETVTLPAARHLRP